MTLQLHIIYFPIIFRRQDDNSISFHKILIIYFPIIKKDQLVVVICENIYGLIKCNINYNNHAVILPEILLGSCTSFGVYSFATSNMNEHWTRWDDGTALDITSNSREQISTKPHPLISSKA